MELHPKGNRESFKQRVVMMAAYLGIELEKAKLEAAAVIKVSQ